MGAQIAIWIVLLAMFALLLRFRFRMTAGKRANRQTKNRIDDFPQLLSKKTSGRVRTIPVTAHLVAEAQLYWLDVLENIKPASVISYLHDQFHKQTVDSADPLAELALSDRGQACFVKAMLYSGKLVAAHKDREKFKEYLGYATDAGFSYAAYELAQLDLLDYILTNNEDNRQGALALYKRCADAGVVAARFMLALIYITESESASGRQEGLQLLNEAADAGSIPGASILGCLYAQPDSGYYQPERAAKYFKIAIDAGHTEACYKAAVLLTDQNTDSIDRKPCLLKAAEKGLSRAQFEYARCLLENDDYQNASHWGHKACKQGCIEAFYVYSVAEKKLPTSLAYDNKVRHWFEFPDQVDDARYIVIQIWLACSYFGEHENHECYETTLALLKQLQNGIAETDFDVAYTVMIQHGSNSPYADFLAWLIADYCQNTDRSENTDRLQKAENADLQIACIVSDYYANGLQACAEKYKDSGIAAISYACIDHELANGSADQALQRLVDAADSGYPSALSRLASLYLGKYDYELVDESFSGLVKQDTNKALELLEIAASSGSRHACDTLSRLYLEGQVVSYKPELARHYRQIVVQNFGDESSLTSHVVRSLI